MAIEGAVGTTFHISATLPATEDQAGYEALTFTKVGEITNLGEFDKQWQNATAVLLDTGRTEKAKSSYDNGDLSIQMLRDTSDAGQVIMEAAKESTAKYAFKIEEPDGTANYTQGLVNSFTKSFTDANSFKFANSNVALTNDIVEV